MNEVTSALSGLCINSKENGSFRKFVPSRSHVDTQEGGHGDSKRETFFKLISYNVLADGKRYGLSEKHSYCSVEYRTWDSRFPRIMKEIMHYDSDIICLQEIQKSAYDNDFSPTLTCRGYKSFYSRVNSRHKKCRNDIATATFVRETSFEILKNESHLLSDSVGSLFKGSRDLYEKLKKLNQSVLLTKLVNKASSSVLVVANVHLFWDPAFKHVKAYQMEIICRLVKQFAGDCQNIIICGDFNSLPFFEPEFLPVSQYNRGKGEDPYKVLSGVYRLMTTGNLSRNHPDHPDSYAKRFPLKATDDEDMSQVGNMTTVMGPFMDAYARNAQHYQEGSITTKTDAFSGAIDYILYQGRISAVENLQVPLGRDFPPIPNKTIPSDHLAVGTRFMISLR